MEYTNADLTKEISGIVLKLSQLEPDIQRSAINSSVAKKSTEEQAKLIEKLEADKEHLLQVLSEQTEELKRQQLKATEHSEQIDKLYRLQTETQKRLDGDSITTLLYANYETVRETTKIISEKLSGKGSVPYDEIVSSFSNTRFLAQVFKYMVGLFGVSGVIAGIVAITGVGNDGKVTVQKLSGEVNTLRKDVDTNARNFETFKVEDFKELRTSVQNNITTLYNRQWDAATKK